ncbi:sulfatase-like hydrolase/transferase [Pontiellaceae bacterium B12227]|nr:sulfatase-like hydrolase/transferase [Pontiellaceae bacterium B12227]
MKWTLPLLVGLALAAVGAAKQPNVVFILLDDVSHYGISAYGAESMSCKGHFENVPLKTPRIDSLAEDGLLCEYAYTYPLCEPTRIALMSGKNNRRNYLNCKAQHESDITFGDLFKRAGYETGIVGKWKQTRGTKEIPGKDYIARFGWDEFFCFDVINMVGRRMIEPNFVLNGTITNYRGIDPETGRRWYGPEIINRYALDFIERKKDKPFFLYYSMVLMHAEHTPTPDTEPKSAYDDFDVNKPGQGRLKGDDRRYFPDMVAYMDKMIGKVLDKLEELGLAENTLVVVMGDNGTNKVDFNYPDGTVKVGNKGTHKDGGLHVPLLMRAPGKIPAGTKYDGLVYVTDMLPMLCDAAGVEIPNRKDLDGISFWPQATGRSNDEPRDAICTWYIGNHHVSEEEFFLEYAFDKKFKRYAPDTMYPEGRFFEWWNDIEEEAGAPVKKKIPLGWNRYRYAGLDQNRLNPEQQEAYDRLGKLFAEHKYVPVERLQIHKGEAPIRAGREHQLKCSVYPANATRNGMIWETSDPAVATVDKFGVLHAHKPGAITVKAYSWDDANPSAKNEGETYLTTGIRDSVTIQIAD